MNIINIIVLVPSILAGIIFGFLFGRIFVRITENNKFCLTSVGTSMFGKKTGFNSQFVNGIKGTLLVLLDLVVISLITGIIEYEVSKIVSEHLVFYFPFTLFILTLAYNIVRKTTKISLKEWLILAILYLGSILSMWALLSYW